MSSLQAADLVGKVIRENIPAFEKQYGCKPTVVILNPLVALALFGKMPESPVTFEGLSVRISAQVDVLQLAIKKDGADEPEVGARSLHSISAEAQSDSNDTLTWKLTQGSSIAFSLRDQCPHTKHPRHRHCTCARASLRPQARPGSTGPLA
jgi:hypothetical protein